MSRPLFLASSKPATTGPCAGQIQASHPRRCAGGGAAAQRPLARRWPQRLRAARRWPPGWQRGAACRPTPGGPAGRRPRRSPTGCDRRHHAQHLPDFDQVGVLQVVPARDVAPVLAGLQADADQGVAGLDGVVAGLAGVFSAGQRLDGQVHAGAGAATCRCRGLRPARGSATGSRSRQPAARRPPGRRAPPARKSSGCACGVRKQEEIPCCLIMCFYSLIPSS